jgi:tetratricopeptide (TPR) repeat protein
MERKAQLAALRRRMAAASARADRMVARRPKPPPPPRLEDTVPGIEAETPHGRHYESIYRWDGGRRHGNMELSRLQTLPGDLLSGITGSQVRSSLPQSWAFLDTETTGLAGGSGTCAFLIGIGRITSQGFEVRQFFMRGFAEEQSQLWAAAAALEDAEVLVTYNGRCFDAPLLESRYRRHRTIPPFASMPHLDLLHGARRIWKLRLDNCKLTELESRILGYEREDDIPGELISQAYFDFVRTGQVSRLAPVFLHNALDIVSLACLTSIVPLAFRDGDQFPMNHAAECVAIGRWLAHSGRPEKARDLFRRAIRRNLRDDLLFRTMWDLAGIEKKLDSVAAAIELYTELAGIRCEHQVDALVALAKHYEHRERDYARAAELMETALSLEDRPDLRHRLERLRARRSRQA